jgi:hypothetical protein
VKQGKQTKTDVGIKHFKAAKGLVLPIFYKGSIIMIVDTKSTEIDLSILSYEGKSQLKQALHDKFIFETGE